MGKTSHVVSVIRRHCTYSNPETTGPRTLNGQKGGPLSLELVFP